MAPEPAAAQVRGTEDRVVYILAVVIGVVAGLRSMLALAVVSWAAHLGALHVEGTWPAFLGRAWVAWIFTALALGELITDQLPTTPSRTTPVPFAARLTSGALAGAAIGAERGQWIAGAVAGVVGAVIGTLGGRAVRARLAAAFGRDRPAALVEDAVAIAGALVVAAL
jgi:uncharacterized membrane protein